MKKTVHNISRKNKKSRQERQLLNYLGDDKIALILDKENNIALFTKNTTGEVEPYENVACCLYWALTTNECKEDIDSIINKYEEYLGGLS